MHNTVGVSRTAPFGSTIFNSNADSVGLGSAPVSFVLFNRGGEIKNERRTIVRLSVRGHSNFSVRKFTHGPPADGTGTFSHS